MDNGSGADDKSVLDYVANDVTALKARLGTSDQAILDQHLASIRAVEHEMWCHLQQCAVLEARRLALGAIRHYDRAPPAAGNRAHLRRGGEGRATVAK